MRLYWVEGGENQIPGAVGVGVGVGVGGAVGGGGGGDQ